jgi:hypothetical protein
MGTQMRLLAVALLVPFVILACAGDDPGAASPSPSPTPGATGEVGEVPPELLEAVVQDAQSRTGADPSQITVVSATSVTWSDGSLGCPEPGQMYTQALVPGYQVVLRAGDEVLDYHASQRGAFVLCPPGRATDPVEDGANGT